MDQFYFEEGYLEASYFTVIREAVATFSVTASQSAAVDIADATGYYIPDYIVTDYFEAGGQVREADAAFTVSATQTAVVERILQSEAAVSVSVTKSCTVTRIRDSAAAFTAAFAPTLTATAFKNHTAVLDSVSTMSVDAVANRSANVLLEHIADLNAMAAKTVDVTTDLSHTATAVITANTNSSAQVTATSTATLACEALNVQFATAALQTRASLFASRYLGTGRPRHISTSPTFNNTYKKFGTASLASFVSVPNDQPIFSGWKTKSSVTQGWFLFRNTGSSAASVIDFGTTWRLSLNIGGTVRFRTFGDASGVRFTASTFDSSTNTINTWYHWAVVNDATTTAFYWNGSRLGTNVSADLWAPTFGLSIRGDDDVQYYLDDVSHHRATTLGYNPNSSTITVPGSATVNNTTTTQFLYHFDDNSLDDSSLQELAQASLSAVVSITAQANANTKQGAAGLSTAATLSAQGDKPASATADLSTTSTLSVIIGSVKDSITLNAGVFTVTAQESRLRDASCSVTSAFSPIITVVATKVGDIALSTVFALTADANSFTDSTADIAAVFAVTAAVDGITRLGSADFSVTVDQTAVVGLLESVSVPITSAFAATISVEYFEGTSLIAPMAAVMSVTAVKTARITKTLSAVTSVSAVVNENAQAPAANPIYTTYQERIDVNVSYSYTYNRVSGTNRRSFYFQTDTGGVIASSLFPNGSLSINSAEASINFYVYEYGQSGQQDWYDTVTYAFNIGVVDSVNTGAATFVNGTGSIRIVLDVATENYLTVYLDGSSTALTLSGPNSVSTGSRTYWPGFEPFPISNQNGRFGWPQALFPSANSVVDLNSFGDITSSSATDLAYIPYYGPQKYGQADLIDINLATLTAEPFSVQFGQASAQVLTAITADVRRIRQGVLNLATIFSTAINAGKNVEIGSDLASQSTVTADAVKAVRAQIDVDVIAAQSTANDRLRTTTAALATTVTVSIDAVKTTGVVVNAESAATQSVTGFRIQQGQASISALYSQLTVAFQNATGTVLLESVSQMQITAEKNAVGVIDISAQFTQSTETADSKTVRVSSAIAAEFTQTVQGLRIQPAGADVSAQFTLTTNTDQSKIARVTVDFTVSVTQTTQAQRFRDGIALQASLGTLSCSIDRLRQANSDLSAVIYDFTASPTFIIRVTADFSAFNSQLTVGDVINLDPALTLRVLPESRTIKITQETRVRRILPETRVNIIED